MAGTPTPSARRERAAREALDSLGRSRAERQLLSVQCSRSHHLAAVYDTPAGAVYVAVTGPHAHGSKDFVDTAHHGGSRGSEHVTLLTRGAAGPQLLPAWCDCGPREVPRADVLAALRDRTRTLHLS